MPRSRRLSSFVAAWVAAGDEVSVIAPLPHYPEGRLLPGWSRRQLGRGLGPAGERVMRVGCVPSKRGGSLKLVDQLVTAGASVAPALTSSALPDVVVASIPGMPTLIPALMASSRWRVPLVLDMRDSWPDLITEAHLLPDRVATMAQRLVFAAQRRASAIVIVPPGFRKSLVRNGISDQKIHDLPNGIDVGTVPVLPLRSDAGRLRVLYLGTLGVSQGLDRLVEALALCGDSVEARFIGGGTERDALETLARRLTAALTFESPVEGDRVWDAYRWADTCLVPLRDWPSFHDAVPSKLYEIMAAGRHVFASVAGVGADIVRDAQAGSVVAPDDVDAMATELLRLAENRNLLNVGEAPRKWVDQNRDRASLAKDFRDVLIDVTLEAR